MPLNILSLDLDWFNFAERKDLPEAIDDFFSRLKKECVLPKTIYMAKEHQYLYPWSVNLLNKKWKRPNTFGRSNGITYRKMRVVNIDEHHDFYYLRKIDFESMNSVVSCGNFFAYMAHQGLLSEYIWVIGKQFITRNRAELKKELYRAHSKPLRKFGRVVKIVRQGDVFSALKNQKFDGFIIVESPCYVHWHETFELVDEVLARRFPRHKLKRCKRICDFMRMETEEIQSQMSA